MVHEAGSGCSVLQPADPVELVKLARGFYGKAVELLSRGDPYTAAGLAWEAVWCATLALAERYAGAGGPPEGVAWREFVRGVLVRAGLGEGEAGEWAALFVEARGRLRGEVYLARWYEEREHGPLFERVGRYLELAERLLSPSDCHITHRPAE
ncbi:MAG: hypothetical protein QXT28_13205 [Thermofilaceae archaeon]